MIHGTGGDPLGRFDRKLPGLKLGSKRRETNCGNHSRGQDHYPPCLARRFSHNTFLAEFGLNGIIPVHILIHTILKRNQVKYGKVIHKRRTANVVAGEGSKKPAFQKLFTGCPKFRDGRGGEIRTHDLLYPKQARYQATLRPDADGAECQPRPKKQRVIFEPGEGNAALNPAKKLLNLFSWGKLGGHDRNRHTIGFLAVQPS